jgi:hypothetical protein
MSNSVALKDYDSPARSTSESLPQGALVLDQVTGWSVRAQIGVNATRATSANWGSAVASLMK